MAWNEPGGNGKDPWGGKRGNNDGPPDLDEVIKNMQNKLNRLFGGKGGSGGDGGDGGGSGSVGRVVGIVAVLALILWGIAGFYQVNEQERAVILRFGVYSDTKGSGLHWNPPLIDKVMVETVTRVREWSTNEQMLTKDLNIVDVRLSVQYNIDDAQQFLLEVKDPESSLHQAANSALRHVAGSTVMHEVLTEGREKVAFDVQRRLQSYLDAYQTGIRIATVNIEEASPPKQVQEAFDDVIRAREDEERLKNEAQAYANGIIPQARGKAQRVLEEAAGYKAQIVASAEGEAQRFEYLLDEYSKAPEVTRQRLYLDAMQDVMSSSTKVLVDVEGGNNMLYLPLDRMIESGREERKTQESQLTPAELDELSNRLAEELRNQQTPAPRRREVR
jgi:membrane protease subunit HflK